MSDNKTKYANGALNKNTVKSILCSLVEDGLIVSYKSGFYTGYEGKSKRQFYVPFIIEFKNGTKWLLFTSNSIRADRMNIQQWNAEHIRRIDSSVERAYLVIPNEIVNKEKEMTHVRSYESRLLSKMYYSAIDQVIYRDDLANLCTNYAKTLEEN